MHFSTILSLLVATASATHLRLTIPSSNSIPHPNTLPPSTHATLTTLGTTYLAPLTVDSYFAFPNVTTGSYLLDVHCTTWGFRPLRVDVHEKAEGDVEEVSVWGTFRGNEWANKGEKAEVRKTKEGKKEVYWFEARVAGGKEYFIERAGFSPLSLLKNPMILIAGFSMLIVFGMPYLMDNMDPELKAEFEERQKTSTVSSTSAANLQNFDAAAWLAGSSVKKNTNVPREGGNGGVEKEKGVTR